MIFHSDTQWNKDVWGFLGRAFFLPPGDWRSEFPLGRSVATPLQRDVTVLLISLSPLVLCVPERVTCGFWWHSMAEAVPGTSRVLFWDSRLSQLCAWNQTALGAPRITKLGFSAGLCYSPAPSSCCSFPPPAFGFLLLPVPGSTSALVPPCCCPGPSGKGIIQERGFARVWGSRGQQDHWEGF